MALVSGDLVQIAVLAFFTGFGTAMGTKLAGNIVDSLEKRAHKLLQK